MKEIEFPEIFLTGQLPENWTKEELVAYGLEGWSNCMSGCKPPAKFGDGMALIGKETGALLPEELLALSKKMRENL